MNNDISSWLGSLSVIGGLVLLCLIGVGIDAYNGSENGMIRNAKDYNNIDSYISYLEKYPNGKYIGEAREAIVDLSSHYDTAEFVYSHIRHLKKDPVSEDLAEIAYNLVSKVNTRLAWDHFMESVPSKYHKDASFKIDSIVHAAAKKEAELWGTENNAWKTCNELRTQQSYEKYLRLYPKGAHMKQANKILIDMAVARDFSGTHGTMPALDKDYYTRASVSTITVTNETSYTMTLLYSGDKESARLVISARGTESIRLPNGDYRISARVDASNVIPYVGEEALTGGRYSASYYISTTRY